MEGRTMKGLIRAVAVLCTGIWVLAFALPMGASAAPAAAAANDTCGYPSSSFTESTVMRWAQINGTGSSAQFAAYANDEAGLLLGVNGATPLSSATSNGANSFHASNASGGSTTTLDPSGRPFYPALYITDLTTHPLNGGTGAGDFQNGGAPRNLKSGSPFVDDVFGTWTTATLNGGTYTATKPKTKNDWTLGSGSDQPVGTTFAAMGDEGFGSEVRWNVNELTDSNGQTLKPGHTYRIQVLEHDGDQNKAGGDAGEFCATLQIPGASPALTTDATSAGVGQPIHDVAHLTGGSNPTGTITWNVYASSDTTCHTPLNSSPLTAAVNGNGDYNSPDFTPTTAGTYQWVATYSGDNSNVAPAPTSCSDPREVSTVGKASPTLTTNAVSGLVGQPIHDVAHLTGGSNPTGTITWNVYASSDTTCTTPLNAQPSALTATVSGDNDYASPDFTPAGAGSYQWVATYSGDGGNTKQSTACGDPNEVSTVTNNAAPAIVVRKVERIGSSGSFTHGPVTGTPGQTVDYRMMVTNTGNTTLVIAFSDPRCDAGTLSSPTVISGTYDAATKTLSSGGELQFTCSHVLAAGDNPYTNTATATGTPPSGPPVSGSDSVKAFTNRPGIKVVKLQRVGSSGSFTRRVLKVTEHAGHFVVYTIDYEIRVTNTGSTTLTLSLSDPRCDAGTIQGPTAISGTLNGNTLSAGGVAQYTCSHRYVKGDSARFTNVATVTGTPPSGPPVHGSSRVTVHRKTVSPKTKLCRTPSGRVIHYKGSKKPAACRFHPKPPKHPQGFTG
jgi:hypothetical protein